MSKKEELLLRSPMSNVLIEKYFDGHANIKTLAEIANLSSLDEVMGNYNHCIIFMALESPNDGHWVCLFENSGKIYYFDSYGRKPLEPIEKLKKNGYSTYGQNLNLINLINDSPFKDNFFYNTYQYQSDGRDIAVCGRYVTCVCVLNIIFTELNMKFDCNIFKKIMDMWKKKMNKSYDEITVFFVSKF